MASVGICNGQLRIHQQHGSSAPLSQSARIARQRDTTHSRCRDMHSLPSSLTSRWIRCRAQQPSSAASEPIAQPESAEPTPDSWSNWSDVPELPQFGSPFRLPVNEAAPSPTAWQNELSGLATSLRGDEVSWVASPEGVDEGGQPLERVYLVGVQQKGAKSKYGYSVEQSLEELGRLASTAGLEVVGQTFQQLARASPRTYIGSGKVLEIQTAIVDLGVQTIIFDDELSPGQQRALGKLLGDEIRLCDRTALILDIFGQRAATREGQLQVELAMSEYQLPRLKKMWSHLERQSGGRTKGMGEKQIEVDKRLLRKRMGVLRKDLDDVKQHRRQYRARRAAAPVPVVAIVGYTNAGKSTLLNRLTGTDTVLAEDKLFATLDPTTRRVQLPSGKEALFTDTVGFIQKLPTQLVAAFRATLEEIGDASLLLHLVDVSHPNAAAQADAVTAVLDDLKVQHIPILTVWNKVDACGDPEMVKRVAEERTGTVAISALEDDGVGALQAAVEAALQVAMVQCQILIPYSQGEIVTEIHRCGVVEHQDFVEAGTRLIAFLPVALSMRLEGLGLLETLDLSHTDDASILVEDWEDLEIEADSESEDSLLPSE